MNENTEKKKDSSPSSWEDIFSKQQHIEKWQDSAFQAALETLKAGHGNPDTVMRLGEAFGRGLFSQQIEDKTSKWTLKEWIEEMQRDIYKPLGTEFTFTKISQDVATTFINRNPLVQKAHEQTVASLFTFGVMRGLFLSAFPKGELVINDVRNEDQPEFIFKAHASAKDKLERQRTIRTLTILKKQDGV